MNPSVAFDQEVGRVAGAIYSDISAHFPNPPLMLVPPITFKVRNVLSQVTQLRLLTIEQLTALAEEIRVAIVPLLFSLDLPPEVIERIAPLIESAAMQALRRIRDQSRMEVQ